MARNLRPLPGHPGAHTLDPTVLAEENPFATNAQSFAPFVESASTTGNPCT